MRNYLNKSDSLVDGTLPSYCIKKYFRCWSNRHRCPVTTYTTIIFLVDSLHYCNAYTPILVRVLSTEPVAPFGEHLLGIRTGHNLSRKALEEAETRKTETATKVAVISSWIISAFLSSIIASE